MPSRPASDLDAARFEALVTACARPILAYALRRVAVAADAEDVVAETFAVAWRRMADVPPDPLPWLYGVARRVIANERRGGRRRIALLQRLQSIGRAGGTAPDAGERRGPAIEALDRLRPDDREILRLVAWEELDHAAIAAVLGISTNAVAIRLHRARKRFEVELERAHTDLERVDAMKGSGRIRTRGRVSGRNADLRHEEER